MWNAWTRQFGVIQVLTRERDTGPDGPTVSAQKTTINESYTNIKL